MFKADCYASETGPDITITPNLEFYTWCLFLLPSGMLEVTSLKQS